MCLLKQIQDSYVTIPRLMFANKDHRNSIPHVTENLAIAQNILEKLDYKTIDELPLLETSLDQVNYEQSSEQCAVYKINSHSNRILFSYRIAPQEFQYAIFHNSGRLQESKLAKGLCGYYVFPLLLSADGHHFESESFSYLIQTTADGRLNVLPLLTLESSIPDYISFQWVFLAMRHFNKTISNIIEYKYLSTDNEEIELLKKVGLYD